MDFRFSEQEERFREEVRAWLRDNLPPGWGSSVGEPADEDERVAFRRDWERKLYRGGWAGIAWPKEYGGRGASLVEQAIFLEESARANTPEGINYIGRNLVGPILINFGTAAQKARFLPAIVTADEVWCQGFSEPNAGSDLASLRCRAVRDGDHYVVTGQKIWTSHAKWAQWCILLVRTDPSAAKHKGISCLLVDMKSAGVTVRPLTRINGLAGFAEVFFDDVRVPIAQRVGAENDGWNVALSTLTFERGAEDAMMRQVRFKQLLDKMIRVASQTTRNGRPLLDDSAVRQKLGAASAEIEVMRLLCLRSFSRAIHDRPAGPEASITKLYWSHAYQRLTELAIELQGPAAPLAAGDPAALADGEMQFEFLTSRAATIYSGASEIQRNIIAERTLGLPRQ